MELTFILHQGIRSILIDKDRNPKWDPIKLESIPQDIVYSYFSPLEADEGNELELPGRQKLRSVARL
ncbi:hypothetical protein KP509_1Z249900 [Ceratopteris richardii]|nr:hypothetical protein KP509_1Z249900 [Ceratopteris richardii]